MPDSECRREPGSSPTAWVLAAPGAGDNRQLETLVDVLDADARWIDQVDPVATVLRDRLTGFRARSLPKAKRRIYSPPWPDLVLTAGGRSVIDARRIRHASGGKSRLVCVGRPWAPLAWLDLIITTPQYRLPAADNVITLDLPLNLAPTVAEQDVADWRREFDSLPRPMLGVLLGGDSGSYRFDDACVDDLADLVNELVGKAGGSAVLVGSPRTLAAAIERLQRKVRVPASLHAWGPQTPNPYAAVLELADALLVTSDSASMLAEACHCAKPLALVHLRERTRSRLNRKLRQKMSGLARVLDALTVRGLWVPAREMPALHRRLEDSGRLTPLSELLTAPVVHTEQFDRNLESVRQRVHALVQRN